MCSSKRLQQSAQRSKVVVAPELHHQWHACPFATVCTEQSCCGHFLANTSSGNLDDRKSCRDCLHVALAKLAWTLVGAVDCCRDDGDRICKHLHGKRHGVALYGAGSLWGWHGNCLLCGFVLRNGSWTCWLERQWYARSVDRCRLLGWTSNWSTFNCKYGIRPFFITIHPHWHGRMLNCRCHGLAMGDLEKSPIIPCTQRGYCL